MTKFILSTIVSFSLVLPSLVFGYRYESSLETSAWTAESSRFMCRLTHKVKAYGEAQFLHRAGEEQRLVLNGDGYEYSDQPVLVVSEPPSWRPRGQLQNLGKVVPESGRVVVRGDLTMAALSTLNAGMLVGFRGELNDTNGQVLDVVLSAVGIKTAFEAYKRCETKLLRANYSQLERSRIQYASGTIDIPSAGKLLLDKMAEYLQEDESVQQIFVDGHSDDTGLNKDNIVISEKRAVAVTNYLLACGVDPSKIITRFHGEKYPVVKNDTVKHKAKNRRTTIRLSRKKQEPSK